MIYIDSFFYLGFILKAFYDINDHTSLANASTMNANVESFLPSP